MTVIDYLPVDKEARPNVLLSQTQKCIISKVMACIRVFLLQLHFDKQQNNSALILACSINDRIDNVFVRTVFCDGPLHAGVSECSAMFAVCLSEALLSP